jgi:phage repressor protein C with HTH and peptisase S24 domain
MIIQENVVKVNLQRDSLVEGVCMSIGHQIRLHRKKRNFSQAKLAEMIGVSQDAVSSYEIGRNEPNLDTIKKIAEALGVSMAALIPDAREATKDVQEGDFNKNNTLLTAKHQDEFIRIPIFENEASAGPGCDNEVDYIENYLTLRDDLIREHLGIGARNLCVVKVRGDSMVPTIPIGEPVIVDHLVKRIDGDGVYVMRLKGSVIIKRVQVELGGLKIISDNKSYPVFVIPFDTQPEDFSVCGRVVATVSLKKM